MERINSNFYIQDQLKLVSIKLEVLPPLHGIKNNAHSLEMITLISCKYLIGWNHIHQQTGKNYPFKKVKLLHKINIYKRKC